MSLSPLLDLSHLVQFESLYDLLENLENGSGTIVGYVPDIEDHRAEINTVAFTFSVIAETVDGENIYLTGSLDALMNWSPGNALLLSPASYPVWTITVNLPTNTHFTYKYLRKTNEVVRSDSWEPGPDRSFTTPGNGITHATSAIAVYGDDSDIYYRSRSTPGTPNVILVAVTFAVSASTGYRESIYLTGSLNILKNWSPDYALPLSSDSARLNTWKTTVYIPASTSFTYKYLRKYDTTVTQWESDPNRSFTTPPSGSHTLEDTWR